MPKHCFKNLLSMHIIPTSWYNIVAADWHAFPLECCTFLLITFQFTSGWCFSCFNPWFHCHWPCVADRLVISLFWYLNHPYNARVIVHSSSWIYILLCIGSKYFITKPQSFKCCDKCRLYSHYLTIWYFLYLSPI
jgi:hypothetical protein